MLVAINIIGWIGAAALLSAYWLVSTRRVTGDSRAYQTLNLAGAALVLINSWYFGAFPSAAVNAVWIAIGAYALIRARDMNKSEN